MFPNTQDDPTCFNEASICIGISISVSLNLRWPIPTVGSLEVPGVFDAAMPETPIDEYRYLEPREDDVCLPSQVWHGSPMDEVPKSLTMQFSSQRKFGCGVLGGDVSHSLPNRIARGE